MEVVEEVKKILIDSTDRDIIRLLRARKTPMTGNEISIKLKLSPSTINLRLKTLRRKGIVKVVKSGKRRIFRRKIGRKTVKISAPSKVLWGLNLTRKRR